MRRRIIWNYGKSPVYLSVIMQTYAVKKGKKVINWPSQTVQNRRSTELTADERVKLTALDEEKGYAWICKETGVKKSTYYNMLNNGFARGDNVDKLRALLK